MTPDDKDQLEATRNRYQGRMIAMTLPWQTPRTPTLTEALHRQATLAWVGRRIADAQAQLNVDLHLTVAQAWQANGTRNRAWVRDHAGLDRLTDLDDTDTDDDIPAMAWDDNDPTPPPMTVSRVTEEDARLAVLNDRRPVAQVKATRFGGSTVYHLQIKGRLQPVRYPRKADAEAAADRMGYRLA